MRAVFSFLFFVLYLCLFLCVLPLIQPSNAASDCLLSPSPSSPLSFWFGLSPKTRIFPLNGSSLTRSRAQHGFCPAAHQFLSLLSEKKHISTPQGLPLKHLTCVFWIAPYFPYFLECQPPTEKQTIWLYYCFFLINFGKKRKTQNTEADKLDVQSGEGSLDWKHCLCGS